MIGLRGRHPSKPASLATISKHDAQLLKNKAKLGAPLILTEKDFPSHWLKYKHNFIIAQYNGKCAYCETSVIAGSPGDVEHFRPKAYCQALSSVKNHNDFGGQPPGRSKIGPASEGYWWLAYKWSNYLLSCSRCNSIWKKNQFPTTNKRSTYGTSLKDEQALLINPFKVNPDRHFEFDARTGAIRGLTLRGKTTIEICGLDRRSLEAQRAVKGAKLLRRYADFIIATKNNDICAQNTALRSIMDECRSKETYAAVARCFVRDKLNTSYSELLKMRRNKII